MKRLLAHPPPADPRKPSLPLSLSLSRWTRNLLSFTTLSRLSRSLSLSPRLPQFKSHFGRGFRRPPFGPKGK